MTTDKTKRFFRVSAEDFKKIPGSPIAYWLSQMLLNAFSINPSVSEAIQLKAGLSTGNNALFERYWFEVSEHCISFSCKTLEETQRTTPKWYPCHSGGEFRKWYGNHEIIIDWQKNGYAIRNFGRETGKIRSAVRNEEFYFRSGLTWSKISSGSFSVRYRPCGFIFDDTGRCGFAINSNSLLGILGLFNSKISSKALAALSPTLSFTSGEIARIPYLIAIPDSLIEITRQAVQNTQNDWDSYETSWDFQGNPLWKERKKGQWVSVVPICQYYQDLRRHWAEQTEEMQTLERCNNNIFIQAYGLQDELSAEVPWDEITLTCNPWYRYGKRPQSESSQETLYQSFECLPDGVKLNQPVSSQSGYCGFPYSQALEERLLADTMKEFISYAVGCMMGRYSLEKPGLILANQGEDFDDYIAKVRTGTEKQNEQETVRSGFLPDRDGVLPILDDEWFVDDIVAQFKDFLKFTFGEEAFSRNLAFIEKAIGKDIRKYFMKDFYKEHVQRYKKRPIYWLFSSPKGSFNALIYLHRYRPDTVSIVLNDYLREFMTKLRVQRSHLIDDNNRADLPASEKSANLKRIDKYAAMLAELEDYERDILFPLAQKQLAIDLDDGVKVNYLKFGAALKEIPGLKAREE